MWDAGGLMNAQSMLAWTRGWSWPKFAGGVAVACAVLYVKENGRSLFMSPFVTLKPDVVRAMTADRQVDANFTPRALDEREAAHV